MGKQMRRMVVQLGGKMERGYLEKTFPSPECNIKLSERVVRPLYITIGTKDFDAMDVLRVCKEFRERPGFGFPKVRETPGLRCGMEVARYLYQAGILERPYSSLFSYQAKKEVFEAFDTFLRQAVYQHLKETGNIRFLPVPVACQGRKLTDEERFFEYINMAGDGEYPW